MDNAAIEKKQFDVRTIIEDAITSLMLQGMTRDAALSLLAFQTLIRMDSETQAMEVMESVKRFIVDDDDDCGVGRVG